MMDITIQNKDISFDEMLFESSGSSLFVCIPKSPSKNYGLVMSMVGRKFYYGETEGEGITLIVARFDISEPLQSNIAMSILELMRNWKGVLLILDGKFLFSHLEIIEILECQGIARSCSNHLAHCTSVKKIYLEGGYKGRTADIVFPCSLISSYFKYEKDIKATVEDQVQALAVRKGVLICPLFDMENYKEERKRLFGRSRL